MQHPPVVVDQYIAYFEPDRFPSRPVVGQVMQSTVGAVEGVHLNRWQMHGRAVVIVHRYLDYGARFVEANCRPRCAQFDPRFDVVAGHAHPGQDLEVVGVIVAQCLSDSEAINNDAFAASAVTFGAAEHLQPRCIVHVRAISMGCKETLGVGGVVVMIDI